MLPAAAESGVQDSTSTALLISRVISNIGALLSPILFTRLSELLFTGVICGRLLLAVVTAVLLASVIVWCTTPIAQDRTI